MKKIIGLLVFITILDMYAEKKSDYLDTASLFKPLTTSEQKNLKQKFEMLNPDHLNLWDIKTWDVQQYKENNKPVLIANIVDKSAFSSCYKNNVIEVENLKIYTPSTGWRIPKTLKQFLETIQQAVLFERLYNPNFEKDHYVSISISQDYVQPTTDQQETEWKGHCYRHINGSVACNIPIDRCYIAYDACPPQFLEGPFALDAHDIQSSENLFRKFKELAQSQKTTTYPAYTLLMLDPYCIYNEGARHTQPIFRTFLKISFVPLHHENFEQKNTSNFVTVNPCDINFPHKQCEVSWAQPEVMYVIKTGAIQAQTAREGEMLETKHDQFLITTQIAKKDDLKTYSSTKKAEFINREKFLTTHYPNPQKADEYLPRKNIYGAAELTKNIQFTDAESNLHTAHAGDFLVYLNENNLWCEPKENFKAAYQIL